jgi:hypothetical protein
MSKRPVAPLVSDTGELVVRRMRVDPREVVFVKGVIEASEGLACVFAESGGDLTIACPAGRSLELDRLMEDLARETAALIESTHTAPLEKK